MRRLLVAGSIAVVVLAVVAPGSGRSTASLFAPPLDMEEGEIHIPKGVTHAADRVAPRDESGGRATAHVAGGPAIDAPVRDLPRGRMYRTGFEAGEPTLGVTKDGSLFFQALSGGPLVVRSRDGAKTWKDVSPKLGELHRHPDTLDPYLYVDPRTDRVFTYDFFFGCSELSFTDDLGKTWTTSPLNCGEMDHQNLFAGPPVTSSTVGYPNVVYTCSTQGGATIYSVAAQCLKSLDGGMTFAPTGEPAFVTNQQRSNDMGVEGYCHGAIGHGFVGDDGTVYVPKGFCGQPWLAISRDEGATWERVQVSDKGMPMTLTGVYEHEAAVAADDKGNVYYFFIGNDRMPYLVVSRNGGRRWGPPMMVGPRGIKEATLPKLDVGAEGRVAIAYYASTTSPGRPFPERYECVPDAASCLTALFFLDPEDPKRYAPVTWNGYLTVTANALGKSPTFYTASVNDPKDPFVRGTCGPIRCKAVYDFIDVVVDTRGRPWASYVDICIGPCANGGTGNSGNEGVVGTLVGGPRLR